MAGIVHRHRQLARTGRPVRHPGGSWAARTRLLAALMPVTLTAALLTVAPDTAHAAPALAAPHRPSYPKVHGHPGKPGTPPQRRNDAAAPYRPQPLRWPAAGTGTAHLATGGTAKQARVAGSARRQPPAPPLVRAGTLPVSVAAAGSRAPASVTVQLADQAATRAAGVQGLLMTVTPAGGSGGPIQVSVDYSDIAAAFGGDYGKHLRLVTLPACAFTTPQTPSCQTGTPLATHNDPSGQHLTAQLTLPAAGRATSPAAASASASASAVTLAATAAPSSASGDYSATSLKPSGAWNAGGSTGGFTYKYPIDVPPVPGGVVPKVALAYNSQSVDGEQAATNNQPSWIGDGWDYSPGYIERSYITCSKDPAGKLPKTDDSCWDGQIVHVSFGDISGDLIYDAAGKNWKPASDDGTKVELLTGGSNGTKPGDYWKLTTRDGTQYFFGRNRLPGYTSDTVTPPTNAAWTLPVYGSPPDCAGAASCTLAWRWNLDYIVDVHGNAAAYYYAKEGNLYGANKSTTGVAYDRGGYLDHIDYGLRDPKPQAVQASARVQFGVAERCTDSATVCTAAQFETHKDKWPDTPGYLECLTGKTCDNHSPSFWSRLRLTSIKTEVNAGGGNKWTVVDTYTLTQSFPGGLDLGVEPALWLASIQRTGGTGTDAVVLPAVKFDATKLDNRVDSATSDGASALKHFRISTVTTETGETIGVQYKTECTAPVTIDPTKNTSLCYPAYWQPVGPDGLVLDWFHKYVVTEIDDQDTTGGAPTVTTSYEYHDPAWAYDDNELVKEKYRTWGQWRGFARVLTRTGAGVNQKTLTETRYYQGMDQDVLPKDARRTATVALSAAVTVPGADTSVPDTKELGGSVREQITYNGDGGPPMSGTVNDYWVSPPTATRVRPNKELDSNGKPTTDGQLPDLTAVMVRTVTTRTSTAIPATGGWRTTQTDTTYDTATGLPTVVYDHGDISRTDQARCTTTSYTKPNDTLNLVGLVAETETDAVACAGSGVNGLKPPASVERPTQVIGATRMFYDDPGFSTTWPQTKIPTAGELTMTRQASDYTGGAFTYVTKSQSGYDTYGRQTLAIDGRGKSTKTTYTETNGLTTSVQVTNAKSQAATTTLEPTRGLIITVSDLNKQVTTSSYDKLGRITGVWRPERALTATPSVGFAYAISQTVPSAVTTTSVMHSATKTAIALYDALDRPRQIQTESPTGGRLITDTYYDTHGWVYKTNNPYYDSGAASTTLWNTVGHDEEIANQTVTTFDGLGRPTVAISRSLGSEKARTRTVYGGDRTTVIPTPDGTPTTTYTDALGRTTQVDSDTAMPTVDGDSVTGGKPVTLDYDYDRRGNQDVITEPATGDRPANTWTTAYNLLGQPTDKTDPDTGAAHLGYDGNGNVTTVTTARGTLTTVYDDLNRRTALYNGPDTSSPVLGTWTYDDPAVKNSLGKVTSATSYDGNGNAYTTSTSSYDTFGDPADTTVTIPADPANGSLAGSYTIKNSYNSGDGVLEHITYPATGTALPAERVNILYDRFSDPSAVGGLGDYIDSSTYTPFTELNTIKLGYGVGDTSAELAYTYDNYNHTLKHTTLGRAVQGAPLIDDHTYNSSASGQLHSSTDVRNSTATETQCYDYDLLGRLTTAWTATDQCQADVSTTGNNATVGGISPYWTSWTYNTSGDRTQQIQHAIPDESGDTTSTYSYPTTGKQPHTLTNVTVSGPAGTSTDSYSYDDTGNSKNRTTASHGSQYFTWDSQGRLITVDTTSGNTKKANAVGKKAAAEDGQGQARYIYGPDGKVLLQRNSDTVTLYLQGEELSLNTTSGTMTGKRYYSLGNATAVRTATTTAAYSYLINDPHGTAALSLDYNTQNPVWRDTDPYGQPRGQQPAAWPDTHGYLGHPTDTTTGLNILGARQYDAAIGRFISPDPILENNDPTQIGGYTYSGDDPINGADPTGLAGDWCATLACAQNTNGGEWCTDCGNAATISDGQGGTEETSSGTSSGDGRTHYRAFTKHITISTGNKHYAQYMKYWNDWVNRDSDGPMPTSPAEEAAWELEGIVYECGKDGPDNCSLDTDLINKIKDGIINSRGNHYANWIVVIGGTEPDPNHPRTNKGGIDPTLYLPIKDTPGNDPLHDASQAALLVSDVSAAVLGTGGSGGGDGIGGGGPQVLYHYTDESGMNGIVTTQKLYASTKASNPRDARYGNGYYLTDIPPGTKTNAQLSRSFLGHPWSGRRFTNFVEIDVSGLGASMKRPNVFYIPGEEELNLVGRITNWGQNEVP